MSLRFKVLSTLAGLGALAVFSGATFAQDTTTTTPQNTDKTHQRGDHRGFGPRRGGPGREGMGPGGGMRGMMRGIQLTDDQKAQLKSLRESNKPDPAQFEQIRTLMKAKRDGTITADQEAQLKAFRESREAKAKEMRQAFLNILTPDQKAQLEKNRADMKARRQEFKQKREEWRKNHPNGRRGDGNPPAATNPTKPGTTN
ncbi:MAG: Spy/CpxP family protein refolding chaperone [Acidobacteria bacterium]|nr:Spy/CpxP family protein refolding chaperone [Acidobacteriota bacterium]